MSLPRHARRAWSCRPNARVPHRNEEHALRRKQHLPYVRKVAVLLGDLVEYGNITLGTSGVRCKIAEAAVPSYPDFSRAIHRQRPDDIHTVIDPAPGNPVVLGYLAAGHAHVHDAATVLQDGPHLTGGTEFLVGMRLENRHADFGGVRRRGRSGLRACHRRTSQCEEHRQSDAPKSNRALDQLDFQWRWMRTGAIVICGRMQVEENLSILRNALLSRFRRYPGSLLVTLAPLPTLATWERTTILSRMLKSLASLSCNASTARLRWFSRPVLVPFVRPDHDSSPGHQKMIFAPNWNTRGRPCVPVPELVGVAVI